MKTFALKGHIVFSDTKEKLYIQENGYAICENGTSKGVFKELPKEYEKIEVKDYGDQLIVPGFVDLHLHAPQFTFRTLGMDLELLDWLNTHTFPEESKYKDVAYAKKAYQQFCESIKRSETTRAVVFATLHVPATLLLMDMMEETGLKSFVGKVNMDRNSPEYLCEKSAEESLKDTKEWLETCSGRYENVAPILTPRFTPSCTDELVKGLALLQQELNLPAQSHLSENPSEIAWVQELSEESKFYGDAYDRLGLFGSNGKTIMAHCVHSPEEEVALMKERGVYIAHCPVSNTNLSSGIAPARMYLEQNLNIGLGTDMAAGHELSLLRVMAHAIQVSKLYWRLINEDKKPLTVEEVFYMATKGGGSFFGKVGSFLEGYEFDAVVFDDSNLVTTKEVSIKDRLERMIYLSDERNILDKYVAGNQIFI